MDVNQRLIWPRHSLNPISTDSGAGQVGGFCPWRNPYISLRQQREIVQKRNRSSRDEQMIKRGFGEQCRFSDGYQGDENGNKNRKHDFSS